MKSYKLNEVEKLITKAAESAKSDDAMRYSQAACNAVNAMACMQHMLKDEVEEPRHDAGSLFGVLANAVTDLRRESERVVDLKEISNGLETGELQEILNWVLMSTRRLKRID